MKKALYFLLFLSPTLLAQYKDGKELLRSMHTKYAGKYCQTITFDQRTLRFDSTGALKDSTYWYEWISYPDKFRIDFGKRFGGNCVIFRNDSVFNYRSNKLVRKGKDENILLLLLGGMYYRPINEVLERLEREGYDLARIQNTKKDGEEFYEVGTTNSASRFLVEKNNLRITSIVMGELQIDFDAFEKRCKGFTETKVSAYKNGKLEQKEEYMNLKTSIAIPDSIFNKK